jgi:hypothetical protein
MKRKKPNTQERSPKHKKEAQNTRKKSNILEIDI